MPRLKKFLRGAYELARGFLPVALSHPVVKKAAGAVLTSAAEKVKKSLPYNRRLVEDIAPVLEYGVNQGLNYIVDYQPTTYGPTEETAPTSAASKQQKQQKQAPKVLPGMGKRPDVPRRSKILLDAAAKAAAAAQAAMAPERPSAADAASKKQKRKQKRPKLASKKKQKKKKLASKLASKPKPASKQKPRQTSRTGVILIK